MRQSHAKLWSMKSIKPQIALALLFVSSFASADDQPLANLIDNLKNHSSYAPSPISLSAVGFVQGRDLNLKFTLTNHSTKALKLSPESLPWGNTYAIRWAAFTGDGRVLPLGYPIDDPISIETLTISPRQSLTGTYRLSSMLLPGEIPPDTDVAVVWLYRFPTEQNGRANNALCTGVTVLHTPK